MRIALTGATYTGNRGAAAMLVSAVEHLREVLPENTEFHVLSLYREKESTGAGRGVIIVHLPVIMMLSVFPVACALFRVLGWFQPIGRLLRKYPPLDTLSETDALLDLSGISFVDGRGATLIYNICSLLPPLIMGIPVIKMSQAMGPFKNSLNRLAARTLLPRLQHIFSRGEMTSRELVSIELRNWSQSADLAFLLDESSSRNEKQAEDSPHRFTLGVVPSQVLMNYCSALDIDYIGVLSAAINRFASERCASVEVIAHSNLGAKKRSRNNDHHVCEALYSRLGSVTKSLTVEDLSPEELRERIARCDVLLTSRFHAMISALSAGTPVLATSWSHKYLEVMKSFRCGEWVVERDELDVDSIYSRLSSLSERRSKVRSTIFENLPMVRESARVQLRYVADFLRSGMDSQGG